MMSRHFRMNSELSGAIAKRPPHAKNQLSVPCSFFKQFVTYMYILYTLPYQKYSYTSLFPINIVLNGYIKE